MYYLFEKSDTLNNPVECFVFDASKESFPVKPHWHYFMEIIYMLDGSAEVVTDGEIRIIFAGDMVLFHPQTVHSVLAANNSFPIYAVFKFDINRFNLTPNYAPKLRSIFTSAQRNGMNIFFDREQTERLDAKRIFNGCIAEIAERKYGFDLIVNTQINALLIGIIRIWSGVGFSVDNEVYAEDNRCDIYNITEYIDENMGRNLKVSEIAARCGMSYSYFAKQFRNIYGKTCKEYVESMRLFKAEAFLTFTDFDLNYISQETGFSDCSHMIKCFRHLKGITPKQFRLQRKAAADKRPE